MLLLLSVLAMADVVGPDPTNCPAGSQGRSNHSGSWCEATHCESECPEGPCREIGLCVDAREVGCGGMQPDTAPPCTFLKEEALGRCRTDADCDVGECVVEQRCATGGGCGCTSAGSASSAVGVALLALLALRPRRRARLG